MTRIITIQQKEEWRNIVSRSLNYDFYHTWYYHSLDRSGQPLLFVYEKDDDFIAFPFIERSRSLSDAYLASVYGYVGPVSNKKFADLQLKTLDGFKEGFVSFLRSSGIKSVSSRLHPFIDQSIMIEKLGGTLIDGKSVVIDLSISIEEQRKKYRRNLWGDIKKMQSKGYHLKEFGTDDAIRKFISIYWENMNRIGAKEAYYFNEQYFFDFMKSEDFVTKLVFINSGDIPICASLITLTNGIIQGYLIGTSCKYLSESPAKLLVDQVSVMGRQLGMKYYNLGGGLNFEEDSLFKWKSGFSRLCFDCNKWTYNSLHEL